MSDKPSGHLPRLLTREQAAAYCGYGPAGFSAKVADGTLPGPVLGTARWDKLAIDRRLDELSGLEPTAQQPYYLDLASETQLAAEREWAEWEREDEKRKARWPRLHLNNREEQAIRALGKSDPTPMAGNSIRGAGDKTCDVLIKRDLVSERDFDEGGNRTFVLTELGRDEYERYLIRDQERFQ